VSASGLATSLERRLLPIKMKNKPPAPYKLKEKTAIVLKGYIDSLSENLNESLDSDNANYLVFVASCFLEDFISRDTLKKYNKYNAV
jgi:hypothetical protein